MRKGSLAPAASDSENRRGWIYFFAQSLVLGRALSAANHALGCPMTEAELNATVYLVNFLGFLLIFRRFLRSSAVFALRSPVPCLFYAAVGVVGYDFWTAAVTALIFRISPDYVNANTGSLLRMASGSPMLIAVSTVVLAPLAEECVFREMLFRRLMPTSLPLAFAVSSLLFSFGHVAGFLGVLTPIQIGLSVLQYLPAGIFLAWSYRQSGSILSPLLMHTIINARSMTAFFNNLFRL